MVQLLRQSVDLQGQVNHARDYSQPGRIMSQPPPRQRSLSARNSLPRPPRHSSSMPCSPASSRSPTPAVPMKAPMPFITFTQTENGSSKPHIKLHRQALAHIQELSEPLAVVAITGSQATGKSHLLNQLAGRSQGFRVGTSFQGLTRGIWCWCFGPDEVTDIFPAIASPTSLILLDTQGVSTPSPSEQDQKLFSLASLLSSFLIYNVFHENRNEALSTLSPLTRNLACVLSGSMGKDNQVTGKGEVERQAHGDGDGSYSSRGADFHLRIETSWDRQRSELSPSSNSPLDNTPQSQLVRRNLSRSLLPKRESSRFPSGVFGRQGPLPDSAIGTSPTQSPTPALSEGCSPTSNGYQVLPRVVTQGPEKDYPQCPCTSLPDCSQAACRKSAWVPRFCVVFRDCVGDTPEDGMAADTQDCLEVVPSGADHRGFGDRIMNLFPDLTFCSLEKPVSNTEQLDNIAMATMTPGYVRDVRRFVQMVFRGLPAKTINGHNVDGPEWITFARTLISLLENTAASPVMTYSPTLSQLLGPTHSDIVHHYRRSMSHLAQLTVPERLLWEFHQAAEDAAIDAAISRGEIENVRGIRKACREHFSSLLAANEKRARGASARTVEEIWTQLLERNTDNFNDLEKEFRAMFSAYDSLEALGPHKHEALITYLLRDPSAAGRPAKPRLLNLASHISSSLLQQALARHQVDLSESQYQTSHAYQLLSAADQKRQAHQKQAQVLRSANTELRYEVLGLQEKVQQLGSECNKLEKDSQNMEQLRAENQSLREEHERLKRESMVLWMRGSEGDDQSGNEGEKAGLGNAAKGQRGRPDKCCVM